MSIIREFPILESFRSRFPKAAIGFVWAALGALPPGAVLASAPTDGWLVRYAHPVDPSSLPPGARIVDEARTLVQRRFASSGLARPGALAFDPRVVRVTPNRLYSPSLRIHPVPARPAPKGEAAFLALPFSRLLTSLEPSSFAPLPEVLLPDPAPVEGPDPLAAKDWAIEAIHLPSVEEVSRRGPLRPVTVAVIDTGVDYNHEDLRASLWRDPADPRVVGRDTYHEVAEPYDVVKFDMRSCSRETSCLLGITAWKHVPNPGHGTHCAGHVAAVAGNALGIRGVGAGAARVMALKFVRDAGEEYAGQGDDAAAIRAIDYALAQGARVINLSWNSRMERAEAERSELRLALERARRAGALVVIAAGNDDIDQDAEEEPRYPAAYDLDNLVVVAASDATGKRAEFSNYGARSVHIAAPGVRVLSTLAGGTYGDLMARYSDAEGQEREVAWDGTSMSAPLVSGAAALLWSLRPDATYREIRELILGHARRSPAWEGKVSSGGVLDVAAALQAIP